MSVLGRGAHSGRKGTPEHPGSYRRIHRVPGNHKSTHEAWVARAAQKERVSLFSTENRTSFDCFLLCPGGLQTSEGRHKQDLEPSSLSKCLYRLPIYIFSLHKQNTSSLTFWTFPMCLLRCSLVTACPRVQSQGRSK